MTTNSPSRRDFLRAAAFTAAGAPLIGAPLLRALPHERSSSGAAPRAAKPLGFAIVGLGSLSTNQIAPALQKTKNCKLAAIVTGTPAKAARWKEKYGIPDRSIYDYSTMDRMRDNPD